MFEDIGLRPTFSCRFTECSVVFLPNWLSKITFCVSLILFAKPESFVATMEIIVNNDILECVDCFKYLGIHLDQSLDWNNHSRKINSKLALFRRLRPFLTEQSSRMLANSLVQPHFDYCSSAWSNCNANLRDSLVRLQKKMGRITAS